MNYIVAIFTVVLFTYSSSPQSTTTDGPLRTVPTEKFTVNPGHRDWTRTAIAQSTIVGGNSSNRGGLFAVDTLSGKLKWTARPTQEPNWPFGFVTLVDAGLWVDSYQALVRLQ